MVSYTDTVRLKHAPTAPTASRDIKEKVAAIRDEGKVEPKLIAAVTSIGRHDIFHPMVSRLGEELPYGFGRSSTGFLFNNNVLKVRMNQEIVCRDIERLTRHAVVAYFIRGKPSQEALVLWVWSL